jgi:hypothetical protein
MRKLTIIAGLLLASSSAQAQNIRQAIEAYNDDKYADAAYLFYDVAQNTDDPDDRVKAEYYLARSLEKADYLLPAWQYYGEVFNQGEEHPYFLRSTEGLLAVAEGLKDDILVPAMISRGYTTAFAQLQAEDLNAINYMVGLLENQNRNFAESVAFLEAVTDKQSPVLDQSPVPAGDHRGEDGHRPRRRGLRRRDLVLRSHPEDARGHSRRRREEAAAARRARQGASLLLAGRLRPERRGLRGRAALFGGLVRRDVRIGLVVLPERAVRAGSRHGPLGALAVLRRPFSARSPSC